MFACEYKYRNSIVCIIILFAFCFSESLYSQNRNTFNEQREKILEEFNKARANNKEQYNNFREKINKVYAAFLLKEWKESKIEDNKVEPQPEPKPVPKPVYVPIPGVASKEIPVVLTERVPKISPQIRPVEPIVAASLNPKEVLPDMENVVIPPASVVKITPDVLNLPKRPYQPEKNNYVSFTFYGNTCKVRMPIQKEFAIPTANNNEVSKAWEILSGETYNDMLVDMLCIRESLSLCDWGFYQLSKHLSAAYFGDVDSNEAAILQTYIMAQLGFKVRLAKQNNLLFPIIAFAEKVYSAKYLVLDNAKYYIFSPKTNDGKIYLCDFEFPGEKVCSVALRDILVTPADDSNEKVVASKKYSQVSVKIKPNKNLVDFFTDYVKCEMQYKVMASLSDGLKEQLYPTLKNAIKGKSEEEAANILIDFVQTGFEYQSDDIQFGYEKAMFADEVFYYPFSDCEDRSILFSVLVKDLLGLEVVLLDYPEHIATAVCFTSNVEGDFFELDGKKFIVCDPTYIGAPVGVTMPELKSLECSVIEL